MTDERLPDGVRVTTLETYADDRGSLTELFRSSWDTGIEPAQWNVTVSAPGVLRGVHVHIEHTDYVAVVEGRADVGLYDVRPRSASHGLATVVTLRGDPMAGLTIPPGIFHGLYFHERSVVMYGLSHGWDPSDDLACRWDDPDMAIPWPVRSPSLSDRDAGAPPLRKLAAEIGSALGDGPGSGAAGI